jgi:hypothetical protein
VVEEETEKTDVAEKGLEEAERGAFGRRAVQCSSRFHYSGGTCNDDVGGKGLNFLFTLLGCRHILYAP